MGIYSEGMTVHIISTEKRTGEYGQVTQARDYGVMVRVGEDTFETYFMNNEIEPAMLVQLAPAPRQPTDVPVSKHGSYNDEDVDDMIGALLVIAETLNLEHVSATQIAQGVEALRNELAASRAREKALEAENARLTKGLLGLKRQIVPTGDSAYDLGRETAYTLISELVDSILRGDTLAQDTAAQAAPDAGTEAQ